MAQLRIRVVAVAVFLLITFAIYQHSRPHPKVPPRFGEGYDDLSGDGRHENEKPVYQPKDYWWKSDEPEFKKPDWFRKNVDPAAATPVAQTKNEEPGMKMEPIKPITNDAHPAEIPMQQIQEVKKTVPSSTPAVAANVFNGTWDYERDRSNLHLTQGQCDAAFPNLYDELSKAANYRTGDRLTRRDLDAVRLEDGSVRAMVYNKQLYVVKSSGEIPPRIRIALLAIRDALVTSADEVPNIEFVLTQEVQSPTPFIWSMSRKRGDEQTWLIPNVNIATQRLASEQKSMPMWETKQAKLLYLNATETTDAMVRDLALKSLKNLEDAEIYSSTTEPAQVAKGDPCKYKYILHDSEGEGLEFSKSCNSVAIIPESSTATHLGYFLKYKGADQNYVRISKDLTNLKERLAELVQDDTKVSRIAETSTTLFTQRYATRAADMCYWRRLFKSWREISFEPELWSMNGGQRVRRGTPVEEVLLGSA